MAELLKCFIYLTLLVSVHAKVYYLQQGDTLTYDPLENRLSNDLPIYCYEGKPKYIIHVWQSVMLQLNLKSDNFDQYDGATPEEVTREYVAHRSSWSLNLFSWKHKNFRLDPFNQSCIGIDSRENYTIHLHVIRIDYWKICNLVLGILLFVSSPKLSKNTMFYYICGVSFGICASFLILIYFISKLFPKRPMMYGVVVGGWTVGVYLLQMLWENIRVIMTTYQSYVMWYAFITGLISFVVCYRVGPVTNQRTQNLMQWALQLLGLISVFHCTHFQEAAMGMIVILLVVYNFPNSWVSKSRTYWKRRFPPKIRPLTNDEYYHQGVRETTKALSDLRKYCSSPDCNQWRTALKIKDVKRFASFVEGNSHLSDNEILEYESSIQHTDLTDDEDMFTDEDED